MLRHADNVSHRINIFRPVNFWRDDGSENLTLCPIRCLHKLLVVHINSMRRPRRGLCSRPSFPNCQRDNERETTRGRHKNPTETSPPPVITYWPHCGLNLAPSLICRRVEFIRTNAVLIGGKFSSLRPTFGSRTVRHFVFRHTFCSLSFAAFQTRALFSNDSPRSLGGIHTRLHIPCRWVNYLQNQATDRYLSLFSIEFQYLLREYRIEPN